MTTQHIRVPGLLTDVDTTARCPVGSQFADASNGKRYVYANNQGATVTVAGDVLGAYSTVPAHGVFSRNASTVLESSVGASAPVVGIAISAIDEDEYGWIQVGGYCSNVTTDEGVSAGDSLVMDGGGTPTFIADLVAHTADITTIEPTFGYATAADTVAVGTAFLTGCIWDF